MICRVAGMHRGPLGRLEVGSEGDAVEGVWSTKSKAGDSMVKGQQVQQACWQQGFQAMLAFQVLVAKVCRRETRVL